MSIPSIGQGARSSQCRGSGSAANGAENRNCGGEKGCGACGLIEMVFFGGGNQAPFVDPLGILMEHISGIYKIYACFSVGHHEI